ncbi:MAG: hypothetical protein ACE5I8_11465, partial [Thermodesulfobacteriota bacterium]
WDSYRRKTGRTPSHLEGFTVSVDGGIDPPGKLDNQKSVSKSPKGLEKVYFQGSITNFLPA